MNNIMSVISGIIRKMWGKLLYMNTKIDRQHNFIHTSIFCTTYYTEGCKELGVYSRGPGAQGRRHPGGAANSSQGTTAHTLYRKFRWFHSENVCCGPQLSVSVPGLTSSVSHSLPLPFMVHVLWKLMMSSLTNTYLLPEQVGTRVVGCSSSVTHTTSYR